MGKQVDDFDEDDALNIALRAMAVHQSGEFDDCEQKIKEVKRAYNIMCDICRGRNMKTDCEVNSDVRGYASITIEADTIEIVDTKLFVDVLNMASDFDALPTVDNRARIYIGFKGTAKRRGK